jgi:hypothetical protein
MRFRAGLCCSLEHTVDLGRRVVAALVGMSEWQPLDNWMWDVADGDYSRLHEDGDEFKDIEAFWENDHEDDENFDWTTKAV